MNRYEVGAEIGSGATGRVHRAVHRATGLPVAYKIIERRGGSDLSERIRDELRVIAALDHPNIPQVLDEAAHDGHPVVVSQLVEGRPLADLAERFSGDALVTLADTLLDALAHAHARRILHRDIKPANVLIDQRGRPHLIDFGIAWVLDGRRNIAAGGGTPRYMAPEQIRAEGRDQGPWTDLYALGHTLWAVITGRAPFAELDARRAHLQGTLPHLDARVEVPPGFEEWLRLLMRKDPAERPRKTADARALLRSLPTERRQSLVPLELEPRPAPPPPLPAPAPSHPRVQLPDAELGLFSLYRPRTQGRVAQRAALWAALARVGHEGRPELALLEGPAGCGKSHLADWLQQQAHATGAAEVLVARHGPGPGPEDGLPAMAARLLRIRGLDPITAAACVPLAPELARPVVAYALGDHPDVVFASPAERLAALQRGLAHLADRPMLLIVDDLQWSEDTLATLPHMLRWDLPLLIVALVQTDAVAAGSAMQERLDALPATRIPVPPLDDEAQAALVRSLWPVTPSLARRVAAWSGGVPLRALELITDWATGGHLRPGSAGLTLDPGAPAFHGRRPWVRRLAPLMLGPEGRALGLAAVLGRTVDAEEWRRGCLALGVPSTRRRMDDLVRQGLVQPRRRGGWHWAHESIRAAALEQADHAGWRRHIESICGELVDDPTRAAGHFLAAGRIDDALSGLLGVVEERARGAHPELRATCTALERTIDLCPLDEPRLGDAMLAAEQARRALNDYDGAWDWQGRALEHGRRTDVERVQAIALRRRAWLLSDRGRVEEARQAMLEARDLSAGDPVLAAQWAAMWSAVLLRSGEAREALAVAEQALAGFDPDSKSRPVGALQEGRARALRRLGRLDEAETASRAMLEAFRANGQRLEVVLAWNNLGEVARSRGDLDEATTCYARAVGEARAIAQPPGLPMLNLGLLSRMAGRHDEAERWWTQAVPELIRAERQHFADLARLGLAGYAAERGQMARWRALVEAALANPALPGLVDEDVVDLLIWNGQVGQGEPRAALWKVAMQLALDLEDARRIAKCRKGLASLE